MTNSQVIPDINTRFGAISRLISFLVKSTAAASVLALAAVPSAYAQVTQATPDLNIRFGTISQKPTVLGQPNKKGKVSVVVTNRGTAIYQGALNLNIYASPDVTLNNNPLNIPKVITPLTFFGTTSNTPLQGTDELLGTLNVSSVSLTPGQSRIFTVDFTGSNFSSPSVVAPGAYYLFAEINTTIPQASSTSKVANQLINTGDPVIVWNAVLLNAILGTGIQGPGTPPPLGARNQAIVHAAIFDAVNAINRGFSSFALVDVSSNPLIAGASPEAAASQAAHDTLVALFTNPQYSPSQFYPSQSIRNTLTATFDNQLRLSLAKIPNGTAKTRGIAIGTDVANKVLALRLNDGAAQAQIPYTPRNIRGEYRPTFPDFSPALLPGFGSVTPFSRSIPPRNPSNPTARLQQFNLNGPAPFGSQEFVDQENFVRLIGGFQDTSVTTITRNTDQTQSALYWALDRSDTFRPPGQWNEFAEQLALQNNNTLNQNSLLFAQLNIALADAGILTWDSKYVYRQLRPISAIRQENTLDRSRTVRDPNWLPLLSFSNPTRFPNTPLTPPFPDYNSGHAAFGGSAGQVLINFFGDNTPFSAPSQDLPGVARSYTTISEAIEDNASSRIYGGVHVPSSAVTRTVGGTPFTSSIGVDAEGVANGTESLDVTSDPEVNFGREIGNRTTDSLF